MLRLIYVRAGLRAQGAGLVDVYKHLVEVVYKHVYKHAYKHLVEILRGHEVSFATLSRLVCTSACARI